MRWYYFQLEALGQTVLVRLRLWDLDAGEVTKELMETWNLNKKGAPNTAEMIEDYKENVEQGMFSNDSGVLEFLHAKVFWMALIAAWFDKDHASPTVTVEVDWIGRQARDEESLTRN